MKIKSIGIDLAKNVFQIHGIDANGKSVLKKQNNYGAQMATYFVKI